MFPHHNSSIYRHLPHHTTWGVPANVSAHIKSQGQAARHSKHYRTSQATTTTACHQRRTRTTAEATDAQGATTLCQSLPQHQPANQQPNASTATSMRRPETIATSTQRKPAGLKQNLPPYNALQKIQQLPHSWHTRARFIATATIPKASYGWLHHMPSAIFCRQFRVDTFKAPCSQAITPTSLS